jgi:hypothetical protein
MTTEDATAFEPGARRAEIQTAGREGGAGVSSVGGKEDVHGCDRHRWAYLGSNRTVGHASINVA